MDAHDFLQRYYRQLEGRTVVGTRIEGEVYGEEGFPVLVLDNGWRVIVQRDPEGNGPGFLAGLPRPAQEPVKVAPPVKAKRRK